MPKLCRHYKDRRANWQWVHENTHGVKTGTLFNSDKRKQCGHLGHYIAFNKATNGQTDVKHCLSMLTCTVTYDFANNKKTMKIEN